MLLEKSGHPRLTQVKKFGDKGDWPIRFLSYFANLSQFLEGMSY